MIQAKDLRIGNWLMGSNPVQVTAIFDNDKVGIGSGDPYTVTGNNPCLSPIPLTPEILEKCGFAKQEGNGYYVEYDNDRFIVIDCLMVVKLAYDNFVYLEIGYEHIKYLHQLQNLYYSLSGIELEVNM